MATIKAVVLKHHKKKDGTFMVKYRLYHGNKAAYHDTGVPAGKNNLDTKGNLKNSFIEAKFAHDLTLIRDEIATLSKNGVLKHLDVESLREKLFVQKEELQDFFTFTEEAIENKINDGKQAVAYQYRSVLNSLRDFTKSKALPFESINSIFLRDYEKFLTSKRTTVRPTKNGKKTKPIPRDPISRNGLVLHMSIIRNVFNQARFIYNDEDAGVMNIKHYPFKKYVIPARQQSRNRNLSIDDIVNIYKLTDLPIRSVYARTMFLVSFFMCGMNARDMYQNEWKLSKNGRFEYCRKKTTTERSDGAFISLTIPNCVKDMLPFARVVGNKYSTHLGLNSALGFGMRDIGERLGIQGLTFYHARHSFATIARNDCRCSKDDVAMALNHIDQSLRITDTYIAKDWSIIDDVQAKVLKLFFDKLNESI